MPPLWEGPRRALGGILATNVTGRRRDDRAQLLWPDGMMQRAAQRAVKPITGTWRSGGTGNRGEAYVLFVVEQNGKIVATDMDRHGQMVGRVSRGQDGRAIVQGTFARSDGTRGSFQWVVAPHGGTFDGIWRAGGRQGSWDGVKQGDGIHRELLAYLVDRQAQLRGAGLARDPALGAMGLAGVDMCDAKVFGVKIGKVPCGFSAEGPGGSKIEVNRRGIEAKPPSLEKIIEETTGTSGPGATPPADTGETPVERSSKFLKIALGVAVVGSIIGLFAYARTRKEPAGAQA